MAARDLIDDLLSTPAPLPPKRLPRSGVIPAVQVDRRPAVATRSPRRRVGEIMARKILEAERVRLARSQDAVANDLEISPNIVQDWRDGHSAYRAGDLCAMRD